MKFIKTWGLTGAFVGAFFLLSIIFFFSPSVRAPLRGYFAPPERRILSVATGQAVPLKDVRVVKLATPTGIILEIYGPLENNLEPLIDSIRLPDARDGHFQFRGRASNLALKDMDGDGIFEIIAPTFDNSLIPHLNIYRFNNETARFEAYIE